MKNFEELMTKSQSSPYCLFTYYCENLGDHIQTLALLQHVTPKLLIPRDDLTPHKELCLLANGWLSKGNLPNKNDFKSIRYVGVHIWHEIRNKDTINAFKDCGTIGCRDPVTRDFLAKNDIKCELSYCATLTFPRYTGKRGRIFCVDIPDSIKEIVLRTYDDAIFTTHNLPLIYYNQVDEQTITDQYRQAYSLLEGYRKAELVISSRLHVVLPCLAFGTPVIYVGTPSKNDSRISILDGMGVKSIDSNLQFDIKPADLQKPPVIDISRYRERYLEFLGDVLST